MPAISALARDCDLIVVAPATADLMAKMAHGHADDLASAILLAANKPILLAPAMNPLMWNNAATRRNVMQLRRDGIHTVGPNAGEMAEAGEAGVGRNVGGDRNSRCRRAHAAAAKAATARRQTRADHRRPHP
jgi:phosphopantothenoylcysteine synthetase/decarboxylase